MADTQPTKADISNQAITVLELEGYSVEYLWHIEDVILEYPWVTKEQALEILSNILSSESIIQAINIAIQVEVDKNFPKPKLSLANMILDAKQKGLDKRYIQALQNKYSDDGE